MSEIGKYIRELRGKRSLREMERLTGISNTYLSTIEKGIDPRTKNPITPSPEVLKKIADALNVPYVTLMNKAGYVDENEVDRVQSTAIKLLQIYEGTLKLSNVFSSPGLPNRILRDRLFALSRKCGYMDPGDFFNDFLLEKIKILDSKRENVDEFEMYYEENKDFFDELILIIQIAESLNKSKNIDFIDLFNMKSLAYNGHALSTEDIERIKLMFEVMFPEYKPES